MMGVNDCWGTRMTFRVQYWSWGCKFVSWPPENHSCSLKINLAPQKPFSNPENCNCTSKTTLTSQNSVSHPKNQTCTPKVSIPKIMLACWISISSFKNQTHFLKTILAHRKSVSHPSDRIRTLKVIRKPKTNSHPKNLLRTPNSFSFT